MSQAAAFAMPKLDVPPMFAHQVESVQFYRDHPEVFNTSDPGTGKTRAWLEWFRERRTTGGGKALVLCPKSIMQAAWLNDAKRWTPELTVSLATAENRREGLRANADIVVVNHDAVRSMAKDPSLLPAGFDTFNIDESGAYKSPDSLRSKAVLKLLKPFTYRTAMNGTPAPNGPLDLFFQMLLVDGGQRLGVNFYRFRALTCEPERVAPHLPHINWIQRPGIMEALAEQIEDVTIRYRLEDVIDMPDRVEHFLYFQPSAKHHAAYEDLRKHQQAITADGEVVSAIHAAALRTKLLQMCIAHGTQVLTQEGWLPIETLLPGKHLVWDGHEWARFDKVLHQGWQPVVECAGVRMTADHLVLTTNGWMPAGEIINANAGERPDRAEVRLPNRAPASTEPKRSFQEQNRVLGMPMRLRQPRSPAKSVSAEPQARIRPSLRMSARPNDEARAHSAPNVLRVGEHQRQVPQPHRQGLSQVRRAWDYCLQPLAGFLRGILHRHGSHLSARPHSRPEGQRLGILPRQLSLDDRASTGAQHTAQPLGGNPRGADDTKGRRSLLRAQTHHRVPAVVSLAAREVVHPSNPVPTYDLANVGSRNQFVVRGRDGTPLVVHNCSGAVYDGEGNAVTFDSARYELIADLVEARAATLVGFQYRHTREALEEVFRKRKIKYGVIDGSVPSMAARTETVRKFEAGDLQCVLAHPQSAGHGLTLVRASAVIWASPTDRSDLFTQFNARIFRAGQKKRTEIIKIAAADTVESRAYDQLQTKVTNEQALLELLA